MQKVIKPDHFEANESKIHGWSYDEHSQIKIGHPARISSQKYAPLQNCNESDILRITTQRFNPSPSFLHKTYSLSEYLDNK